MGWALEGFDSFLEKNVVLRLILNKLMYGWFFLANIHLRCMVYDESQFLTWIPCCWSSGWWSIGTHTSNCGVFLKFNSLSSRHAIPGIWLRQVKAQWNLPWNQREQQSPLKTMKYHVSIFSKARYLGALPTSYPQTLFLFLLSMNMSRESIECVCCQHNYWRCLVTWCGSILQEF